MNETLYTHALQASPAAEDYIDPVDGLLHCGKCRTPKEKYFTGGLCPTGMDRHPIPCRCMREEQERQDRVYDEMHRRNRMHQLREEAFRDIPAESWRFDSGQETAQMELARRFVEAWDKFQAEGLGLLLSGNVGTGKSYTAGCIANALIDQLQSVFYTGVSDVVNRMQGLYGEEREQYLKTLMKPDLLILDDLGAERSTSFGREQVFDVVNKRTLSRRPLIITTNIPLHIMKETTDLSERRIYDRILSVCAPVRFDGENFRRAGAADSRRRAAELLGRS